MMMAMTYSDDLYNCGISDDGGDDFGDGNDDGDDLIVMMVAMTLCLW